MTSSQGYPSPVPPSSLNGLIVADNINRTLSVDNPAEDWENIGGEGKVNFRLEGGCDDLDETTTPTIGDIAIEYHVTDNASQAACNVDWEATPPQPGPDNVSCAYHDVVHTWPGGHQDHKYAYVFLDSHNIDGGSAEYYHTINHETGHVLGLSDPNVPSDPADPGYCIPSCDILSNPFLLETCIYQDPAAGVLWVESIMHSNYYCGGESVDAPPFPTNLDWPSWRDRAAVDGIAHEQ